MFFGSSEISFVPNSRDSQMERVVSNKFALTRDFDATHRLFGASLEWNYSHTQNTFGKLSISNFIPRPTTNDDNDCTGEPTHHQVSTLELHLQDTLHQVYDIDRQLGHQKLCGMLMEMERRWREGPDPTCAFRSLLWNFRRRIAG